MRFTWMDHTRDSCAAVDNWLDGTARRNTGLDDGWAGYVDYWTNEENTVLNENFWFKIVAENDVPFAAVAVAFDNGVFIISELIVAPEKRGQGYGVELLTELLKSGKDILGKEILRARAVIFSDNNASQRAFEKAGFKFDPSHSNENARDYIYQKE